MPAIAYANMMRHRYLLIPLVLLLLAAAPVPLSEQSGTELDRAARMLVAQDLNEAEGRRERPLILVGSARLGRAQDQPALFVQLQSPRECGSAGCNTSVYLRSAGSWRKVLDSVSGPIVVADTRRRGMRDLLVGQERYVWNGTRYVDIRPAPAVDVRPQPRPAR